MTVKKVLAKKAPAKKVSSGVTKGKVPVATAKRGRGRPRIHPEKKPVDPRLVKLTKPQKLILRELRHRGTLDVNQVIDLTIGRLAYEQLDRDGKQSRRFRARRLMDALVNPKRGLVVVEKEADPTVRAEKNCYRLADDALPLIDSLAS